MISSWIRSLHMRRRNSSIWINRRKKELPSYKASISWRKKIKTTFCERVYSKFELRSGFEINKVKTIISWRCKSSFEAVGCAEDTEDMLISHKKSSVLLPKVEHGKTWNKDSERITPNRLTFFNFLKTKKYYRQQTRINL